MKKVFRLKPLRGIEWDNKVINLGDSKQTVEKVLGRPEIIDNSYYFFNSELRMDFDKSGSVEFIEFLGGIDGELRPEIYGVNVFETLAEDVKNVLCAENDGAVDDSENGYSYAFLNSSVGVYRECIPEDVEEMIAEMEQDGIDTCDNEDIEYEKRKANYWATIGIGKTGYYK